MTEENKDDIFEALRKQKEEALGAYLGLFSPHPINGLTPEFFTLADLASILKDEYGLEFHIYDIRKMLEALHFKSENIENKTFFSFFRL